ncbi:MAG: hypothetical protein CFE21_11390 [Bacteroidetes bacterium B1(2017)]|nr:MAG: hypothetical protein CFE21_11390 [Bacteroidetes bacterium B1(2017)]
MRITKIGFLLLFFCQVLATVCKAQEENYVAPTGLNNWYVEAGGPALFYSINYEKYLYRTYSESYTWSARVGAGYTPFNFDILNTVYVPKNTFMFPFSTSLLIGSGREKLEVGGGFTMFSQGFSENQIVPHAVFGLRVMEANRICFRLNYAPFYQDGSVTHWVGISLGKNFSFK